MKVENFEPRGYKNALEIAKSIQAGNRVIVNFTHLPSNEIQRVSDFLSGILFATEGTAKKLSKKIYEFVPVVSKEQIEVEENTSRLI